VDRYLELVNPTWSLAEARGKVTAVRHETADSVTLTLKPNGNWLGFRAGQYVRFGVEIDGVRRTRCFSPASSVHPKDGLLEITAKVNPDGEVTRFLKEHATPGLVLTMSQAEGDFALPTQRPERLLLISGGSGITPVMSMLRSLCDEGYDGEITFLHYNFTDQDVVYAWELADIAARHSNVRLVRAYTTQTEGGELHGFFARDHLVAAAPDYATAETYVCGPAPLMNAIGELFAAEAIEDKLHTEQFVTAVPVVLGEAEGEIQFARTGKVAANDGGTLLEQAEAAGLTPEFGCRMGICFTCTSTKTAGPVRNVLTGEVSDEADEEIQLCINVPCGDVALDI
jgi:ferredoxin-NADP reductase